MSASTLTPSSEAPSSVPQPKFRWATRIGLPIIILLAFAGLFAGSMATSLTPAVAVETVPVVERPAIARTAAANSAPAGETVVQAAGWIEPDPFPVYATALTDGSVEEVLFLEGENVTRDQVLVRLVDEDARLALQRAEAEARAAQEAWDANIEARREASVAAARVRETQAELELARAELQAQQAHLRELDRIYKRRQNLVGNGTVSEEEFETARAKAEEQSARVRVVERRLEKLEATLERVRAEEAAARRNLELRTEERRRLDLARVALAEAQLRVERLEIVSPIDGVVMRRLVEPGSVVMAGGENPMMARVAELYDPERLQVRVDVPLADAAQVGVGQKAEIIVEVLPDRTFSGTVTRITNFADIQKNTLEVKVALEDPEPVLKPEMLARVRFLSMARAETDPPAAAGLSVFAPAEAIADGVAWVVTDFDGEEGTAARRIVSTTGAQQDGWSEIESGLQPGDLLVVSSEKPLEPEQRVRLRQGGAN